MGRGFWGHHCRTSSPLSTRYYGRKETSVACRVHRGSTTLEVRSTFEPSRVSPACVAQASEQVVPMIRRTTPQGLPTRQANGAPQTQRVGRRSAACLPPRARCLHESRPRSRPKPRLWRGTGPRGGNAEHPRACQSRLRCRAVLRGTAGRPSAGWPASGGAMWWQHGPWSASRSTPRSASRGQMRLRSCGSMRADAPGARALCSPGPSTHVRQMTSACRSKGCARSRRAPR